MQFAAFFLAFKGVQNIREAEKQAGNDLSPDDLFKNAVFRNIVVSLVATIGLYVIASVLFVSPLASYPVTAWLTRLAVRAMAYDYLFPSVSSYGTLLHCRTERLCCMSY